MPLAAGAWAAAWLGTWGSPAGIVAAAAAGVIVLAAAVLRRSALLLTVGLVIAVLLGAGLVECAPSAAWTCRGAGDAPGDRVGRAGDSC